VAEHLLSNVYQVGGGDITHPLDGASYLIRDPENKRHALIDCGSPFGYPDLEFQQLRRELDIEIGKIAVIYATHGHYDHVAAKVHMPDTPLYLHPDDQEGVLTADKWWTAGFLYKTAFPHIASVETITDGYETAIGKTVLRAIHTPGHSPGSVCYKVETEEGTILVAGDTLWGGYNARMGSDITAWIRSLDKLAQDKYDYVTFGHGVSWLVSNALGKHIDKARSRFGVNIQPSHGGEMDDPWAELAPLTPTLRPTPTADLAARA
jgi:glyoxylase-like metal-dependent hydrolase (beta-lactamase superfamily II)